MIRNDSVKSRWAGRARRASRAIRVLRQRVSRVLRYGLQPRPQEPPLIAAGRFFLVGLSRGAVNTRASSIAFQFLLATPPTLLFIASLVPYLPADGVVEQIVGLLGELMPAGADTALERTVRDALTRRSSLPLIGFGLAIVFASNGITNVMRAFDATAHAIPSYRAFARRRISVWLLVLIPALMIAAGGVLAFGNAGVRLLQRSTDLGPGALRAIVLAFRWTTIVAVVFVGTVVVYRYAAPRRDARRSVWRGAVGATLLMIFSSLGFRVYVASFGRFNQLFGSIGTLVVVMVWMKLNAIGLLLGYELNLSIEQAGLRMRADDA